MPKEIEPEIELSDEDITGVSEDDTPTPGAGAEPEEEEVEEQEAAEELDEEQEATEDEEGEVAEDDEAPAEDVPPEPVRTRSPTRRNDRLTRLAAENKALRDKDIANAERLARLEATVEATARVGAQHTNHAQQQEQQRQRQALLDAMEPNERAAFLNTEKIQNLERTVQNLSATTQHTVQATTDKMHYDMESRNNPIYRDNAAEVEKEFAGLQAKGIWCPRDVILNQIVGKKAIAAAAKGAGPRQAAATRRAAAATPRTPGRVRADGAGARKGKSLEERLAGIQL